MEDHRDPRETAGGPEGVGSPVNEGEDICQDLVRSSARKSLSTVVSTGFCIARRELTPFVSGLVGRRGGPATIIV